MVPALVHTLEATNLPRVAAHAGAALVNFSEDCPKVFNTSISLNLVKSIVLLSLNNIIIQHIISAYLAPLMGALERVLEATYQKLLSEGKKLILEQV